MRYRGVVPGCGVPRPPVVGYLELDRVVNANCRTLPKDAGGCGWLFGKRVIESEDCPAHALVRDLEVARRLVGYWAAMPEFRNDGRRWPWDAIYHRRAGR